MKKKISALGLLAGAGLVQAHEGHGLSGLWHWHAGDMALLLAVAALVGLGLWLARRKQGRR